MQSVEFTLKERAGRMLRQLLILQRVFQQLPEPEDAEFIGGGDGALNLALCAAIKEVIDELTEHAGILMSAPFPISEWRFGDGSDDERWRALTEIERRELLALVSGYESLISWSETACGAPDSGERAAAGNDNIAFQAGGRVSSGFERLRDAADFLQAQRTRLGRFRKDMMFLERRQNIG